MSYKFSGTIIILHNPIDRAYSNYLMEVRDRLEKMNFEDALDAEAERRTANWAWGWSGNINDTENDKTAYSR